MMRVEIKDFVFLLLVIMSCCATKPQEIPAEHKDTSIGTETKIKEIVLVNAGESDRCQMGELVQRISKCNPKVIGINFLFIGEKDVNCDSTLRGSIIDSDKVVLVEGFENGNHVESNRKFTEAAFLTGLKGLIQSEDGITNQYYRLIDHRGKWELSFPFLLALQLNKNRAAELSSKVSPQEYPINFYHRIDEFKALDYNADFSSNCNLLEEKIVIIGYLGPTEEDTFQTPVTEKSSDRTYGTVILANIILDILKDLN